MGYLYGMDIYYLILVLPAFFLALFAQMKVKSTFSKYQKIANVKRFTGADVARDILRRNGIYDVQVEMVRGSLTDHYDPRTKVVRLSESVYNSQSLAAIGVAAHETGHAIQHQVGYMPVNLRTALVPVARFGSSLGPWMAILGIWWNYGFLIQIGLILFAGAVGFYLITLPVEFNASTRAVKLLDEYGILRDEELPAVKKVLSAAAMTYVASALVAMANLLRLLLLSNRRR